MLRECIQSLRQVLEAKPPSHLPPPKHSVRDIENILSTLYKRAGYHYRIKYGEIFGLGVKKKELERLLQLLPPDWRVVTQIRLGSWQQIDIVKR